MSKQHDADVRDLEAELDASHPEGSSAVRVGDAGLYRMQVAGKSGDEIIVEVGPRTQGAIPASEFEEEPQPGSEVQAALVGRGDGGLWNFSVQTARRLAAWNDVEVGSLVKGTVVGINKGGLELKVAGARGFLPASQVALTHIEDLASYGGQTLVCEVLEVDREKRSVVLSRRSVLEEEARRQRVESASGLTAGAVVRGTVKRLESYGAFVEIAPGLEGLLHVSNLAHRRVAHPEEVLKVGQQLEVQILEISPDHKRVGLGRKQLEADPWEALAERLRPDDNVTGTVRRLADFGAFVEVEPGIEGLLHISQLGQGRVRTVAEVLKVGQEISVRVVSVDAHARRLSLSRLDERGAVVGSEEAAAGAEIQEALKGTDQPLGTNLGALFQKAMKQEEG